jgi:hypothetical protein
LVLQSWIEIVQEKVSDLCEEVLVVIEEEEVAGAHFQTKGDLVQRVEVLKTDLVPCMVEVALTIEYKTKEDFKIRKDDLK